MAEIDEQARRDIEEIAKTHEEAGRKHWEMAERAEQLGRDMHDLQQEYEALKHEEKDGYGNYVHRKGMEDVWLYRMGFGFRIYRMYDAEGALLYIGKTGDPRHRNRLHFWRQPWIEEVASITAEEQYMSEGEAYAAEKAAIRSERPRYNIVGNGR